MPQAPSFLSSVADVVGAVGLPRIALAVAVVAAAVVFRRVLLYGVAVAGVAAAVTVAVNPEVTESLPGADLGAESLPSVFERIGRAIDGAAHP